MTEAPEHLIIDDDGDACLSPPGRYHNLVALPARDDDGEILNPDAWKRMVCLFNEADAMVAAAFAAAANTAIGEMMGLASRGESLEDYAYHDVPEAIRTLTPVDARAALEKAKAEAAMDAADRTEKAMEPVLQKRIAEAVAAEQERCARIIREGDFSSREAAAAALEESDD